MALAARPTPFGRLSRWARGRRTTHEDCANVEHVACIARRERCCPPVTVQYRHVAVDPTEGRMTDITGRTTRSFHSGTAQSVVNASDSRKGEPSAAGRSVCARLKETR